MTDLEPLSAELAALCATERERPDGSSAAAERLLSRLRHTLSLPPDGGDGPGGGGSGGAAPGAGSGASTLAPPAAGATGAFALKPLAALAAAFALGVGTGAGAMVASPPARPMVRVEQPLAPRAISMRSVPAASPMLTPEDLKLEERRAGGVAPVTERTQDRDRSERDVDLARERSLLGMARTALAKRDGRAALSALDRHAREFEAGRLAEERESLRVQALVVAGDRESAKQHAQRFQERYPKSLLRGAVDESLGTP
jgi:hypothetical protein